MATRDKMRRFGSAVAVRFLAVLLAWACLGSSCRDGSDVKPATPSPVVGESDVAEDSESTLEIGNQLEIQFSGVPNPPTPLRATIRESGTIQPPLLDPTNPVKAAGRTVDELRNKLMERYVPGLFNTLTITIEIVNRYYSVTGEVRMPNTYTYIEGMTVMDAIAKASDINDFGSRKRIKITRKKDGSQLIFNLDRAQDDPSRNIPLYPGDHIHVPRRRFF